MPKIDIIKAPYFPNEKYKPIPTKILKLGQDFLRRHNMPEPAKIVIDRAAIYKPEWETKIE